MTLWLVVVGSLAVSWYYGEVNFKRGYDARVAEQVQTTDDALAISQRDRDEAVELVKQLQARKPEVIIREIPKVVERSDCKRLGADFVQLFNRMHEHDASNTSRVSGDVSGGGDTD